MTTRPADPIARQQLRQRVRLERWATVLAHVVHFGPDRTREVVARFGLDLETWAAIDEAWSSELAEAYRRQQNQQAARFASAFFRTRIDLAGRAPPLASVGDAARLGPEEATPPTAAPDGAPQRVAASFQLATPATGRVPPALNFDALQPAEPLPGKRASRTAELRESRIARGRGKEIPFVAPSSEESLPIGLEAYARITVRLARREERGAVLAELGMDEATWLRSARGWSDRLRSDEVLMQAYVEIVGRLKTELGGG